MGYGEPVDSEPGDVTETDGSGSGDGECSMHHVIHFISASVCIVVYIES